MAAYAVGVRGPARSAGGFAALRTCASFCHRPLELVEDPLRDRFAILITFACMWLPSLSAMGRKLPLQHFVVESIISMREDFAGDFYKTSSAYSP
jgi:hypothetical protein